MSTSEHQADVVVLGAGPGGYPAAFHAADLGMNVVLVDRDPNPGGVCLYRGCIPSKALLHAANLKQEASEAAEIGLTFQEPDLDLDRLRQWKRSVVDQLTQGLGALSGKRGVTFVQGTGRFDDANTVIVHSDDGEETVIRAKTSIIATGSQPIMPSFVPDSDRIMDSTDALDIPDLPDSLLVIGGGYIGLELGQVYATFGAAVSVVEMMSGLLPGVDRDLVSALAQRCQEQFDDVLVGTRVASMDVMDDGVVVSFDPGDGEVFERTYDKVLVAVGRRPVTEGLGLENTGVRVNPQGFITVDEQRRTDDPAIFAVGDIAGQPMLAHKATHEGRSAVEAINNENAVYDPRAIPAVVFTDPEIAWTGLSEDEARRQGLDVRCGTFPWKASGRAATLARRDGLTKIVTDAETGRVLGIGIAGPGAGELIGEGVLAIEMGAVAEDLALTIHAHPSLSETIMEAAEQVMGQSTHWFQRL